MIHFNTPLSHYVTDARLILINRAPRQNVYVGSAPGARFGAPPPPSPATLRNGFKSRLFALRWAAGEAPRLALGNRRAGRGCGGGFGGRRPALFPPLNQIVRVGGYAGCSYRNGRSDRATRSAARRPNKPSKRGFAAPDGNRARSSGSRGV
jgi:hypothetical protein